MHNLCARAGVLRVLSMFGSFMQSSVSGQVRQADKPAVLCCWRRGPHIIGFSEAACCSGLLRQKSNSSVLCSVGAKGRHKPTANIDRACQLSLLLLLLVSYPPKDYCGLTEAGASLSTSVFATSVFGD
jgi:hypothetical protein